MRNGFNLGSRAPAFYPEIREGVPLGPPRAIIPVNIQTLKNNMVRLTNQEWERWGRGTIKEWNQGIHPVLQNYWLTGTGRRYSEPGWWSKYPWSAAFISWIMKKAGAGNAFRYAGAHAVYIKAAKDNRLASNSNPFKAYRVNEIRPQVGDVVCKSRAGSGANYENIRPGHKTHCDIVTAIHPNRLTTIGGNVKNSVSKTFVSTNADGYINHPGYFAVIRIGASSPLDRREIGPSEVYAEFDRETRSDIELSDQEWEEERGRRIPIRAARFRSRPVRRRPFPMRPWRPTRLRWRRRLAIFPEPSVIEQEPQDTDYIRWVQSSLNRIMGLRLPVDGIMEPETRSTIRSFQKRQGLTVTGTVGPETERALVAAGADPPPETQEFEAFESEISPTNPDGIRWIQSSLNKILGLRLPVDGLMGAATRSAIRRFQQRQGLTPDGIVGPKTKQALLAAGASPLGVVSGQPGPATACPPRPVFVDCPPPGAPFEVLDNFAFDGFRLNRSLHTPRIIRIARQVIARQSSPNPVRSLFIAGHTDRVGDENYNFLLSRRRAEEVMRELCNTLERMSPGLASRIKFELTPCGERQPKATPGLSRRVEIFLPARGTVPPPVPTTPPTPPPSSAIRCVVPLTSPGPTAAVPSNISNLLRLVAGILRSLPLVGSTGVVVPTAVRFLDGAEQSEAMTIYHGSLDLTKILIADGLGFLGRKFTVAVPLSIGSHVVMMMGDLCSWATRPRSATLIHELAHAWQSQHHASDPQAFMKNSVECQVRALADVPIAKAAAASASTAAAVRRGVMDPVALASIGRSAAAAEDVSAYAYVPGRPFGEYAAEQIAQQTEDTYLGRGRPTASIVPTIRSVSANARSLDNESSLTVISFHRRSTPKVVFR